MQSKVSDIIGKIANELGIPEEQVEKAWRSQFKVLLETMSKGPGPDAKFKTIRLPYWATYRVSNTKRNKYLKAQKIKQNDNN